MIRIIRIIITAIEIIVCLLLQSSVFSHMALANVVPDLFIILIFANAYKRGIYSGMLTGMACGLIIDCMYGNIIGISAILYMVIGYLNGYASKFYDPEDITIPMVLIGTSEFVYCFFTYVVSFLLRGRLSVGYYMFRIGLPSAIYTIIAGIFFYKVFQRINHRIDCFFDKEEI